ncbi:MAG: hypothetical protein Q8873_02915 [Bacillota bacterium]|nr:hypothetical protein [Bacillota bacterium]
MENSMVFDENGVSGEVNREITPEKMARLGCVTADVIGKKIAVSTDAGSGSTMIKNAVISGLLSGGASALDFGEQPIPITRSGIKFYNLKGGLHISLDGGRVDILDSNGINPASIHMKKIETECNDGNVERAIPETIRDAVSLQSYKLYYIRDIVNSCRNEKLDFNILICVNNPTVKGIVIPLLRELGCKYTTYKNAKGEITDGFASVVKKEGYDMGAYIGDDGEKLILCDGKGRILSQELYDCLCAIIIFKHEIDRTYVVSVSAPSVIDNIAASYGGEIIRTKMAENLIMSKVSELNREGLCAQFVLNFDPVGGLIKIMDFLKTENSKLENIVDAIPKFYMAYGEVECGEDKREAIMNKLTEENKSKADITDGVKIYENGGWTLISPQRGKNSFRIISEGMNTEMADELMVRYSDIIKKMNE